MKKVFLTIATAGLMAAGLMNSSAIAQTPAEAPAISGLIASVNASCVAGAPAASQSQACIDAIVLLLAWYPDSAEAISVAEGFIGADGVAALAEAVSAQRELLGFETGAVDLGADGDTPGTPS